MVRVEMLTVGKELLIGRTLNTNAHWAGARIARIGTMLKVITTVDDDVGEISSSLKEILRRSPDFVIIVGGLGPTPDDRTLEGIAKGIGVELRVNRAALSLIRKHYAGRGLGGLELTSARRKMGTLPAGAEPVANAIGTAPGVRIVVGPATLFSLPGVPAEMRSIFRRSVEPEVRRRVGRLHRSSLTLNLEGILESAFAPMIAVSMRKHPGAYIKSHPGGIRNGISRLGLDIVVVGDDARLAGKEAFEIARELTEAAIGVGARVKSARKGRRPGG